MSSWVGKPVGNSAKQQGMSKLGFIFLGFKTSSFVLVKV